MTHPPKASPSIISGVLRRLADAIDRGVTDYHEYERLIAPYVHYERRIIQLTKPTPIELDKKTQNPVLYMEMGEVKLMGVSRKVEVMHPESRVIYHGPHVRYLRRFAQMPKPSRLYWHGKITTYNECAKLFKAWKYVEKKGKVNQWTQGYTAIQRLEFADQWDVNKEPKR